MRSKRTCKTSPIQVLGQRQNQEGFTIIEVLMAISIFAVGMLAVATMQYSAIRVNSSANYLTMRTTYAMDRMEKLMALSYNDPWLEPAGNPLGLDSAGNTHRVTTSDNHTVSWNITDNNPIQNCKRIEVQVAKGGKTTQLVTIKSNI
jgi:type IV pilus assembly protein PilV